MIRLALVAILALSLATDASGVTPGDVARAVRAAWESAAPPPGAELEITTLPPLPAGTSASVVEATYPTDAGVPGRRAVPVAFWADGRTVARGLATVVVRTKRALWVAARDLPRGHVLGPGDVTRAEHRLARPGRPVWSGDPAAGGRLTRAVAAGAVLRRTDVRERPDVESGQTVDLVAESGRARVRISARARRSGCAGDVILVENPISGALVRAVVLGPGTARVEPARKKERRAAR